jgi:glutathione S-transferase
MRARMALRVAGTDYEHREVLLRDKPQQMLDASPKGSVPVFIRADGSVLDESIDIMRWALPDADIASEIINAIDGPFKHHLDRYKYASRYDETAKRGDVDLEHRQKAVDVLNPLDAQLETSPFLSGATLGPNDMASFPFVRQFAAVEPEWWAETYEITNLQLWLKTCLESEVFSAVMTKHPVWVFKT